MQGASELALNPLVLKVPTSWLPKALTGDQKDGEGCVRAPCLPALLTLLALLAMLAMLALLALLALLTLRTHNRHAGLVCGTVLAVQMGLARVESLGCAHAWSVAHMWRVESLGCAHVERRCACVSGVRVCVLYPRFP